MPFPRSPDPDRLHALERENQRLRRSVQELSLLNELAREIGASLDPDEVMHKIVRRALKAVHAEQGLITMVEEEGTDDPMRTLVRTAGSEDGQDPHRLNDSLLGWMHLHKQPLCINDPPHDSRFRGIRWDAALRSILCAPLLIRSRLIGILTVFNKRDPSGFTADDQRLLAIIAAQSAQVVENARLYEEEKALLTMREELRLAFDIQTSLLPETPPEVSGYDIAGTSLPARAVGGDYYDYIPLPDARWGLGVGDVSGKGLPASLLMSNVQATLRGQALLTDAVGTCLAHTNQLLCQRIRRGTFVTLFYGVLDPARHAFHYANAGHNRPLLAGADGSVTTLDLGGLVLGFMPDQDYAEATHPFAPGDVLLIYSDGIVEAMNAQRIQYGEERLTEVLRQHRAAPAHTLIDQVRLAVQHHAGSTPQTDDMTMLVIKRDGQT